MTGMKPARSPLDRAFFAMVRRGWDTRKIDNTIVVFVLLPLLYLWTPENPA